jgi:hypothetical protein
MTPETNRSGALAAEDVQARLATRAETAKAGVLTGERLHQARADIRLADRRRSLIANPHQATPKLRSGE